MNRDEEIFAEALEITAGERPAFLDRACAGDPAQRARVAALLSADDEATRFMVAAPARSLARKLKKLTPPDQTPGERIGRYRLLEKIGEGGCGIVYLAEQEEPVRRRVALKVIKLGMDTKEVIARFQAERQALAIMDHPHIAKVLDAGATEAGRPYFVMEYVAGTRITTFCDEQNLSTAERLELFIQVCQAIQHAHQKGIIHRDIKPSNILVATLDGPGGGRCPKVIDFGIAKATQGKLSEETVLTAFAQFIGTPAYMSPEQAELSGLDIDTRSDIYSLGVLLYELIAGLPPFDPHLIVKAGIDEIRRQIREVEPPRPSTRISTLTDEDRTTIARCRGTDALKLTTLLKGDLDWIVMRCLEKERARRYETANGLALDIQRFLDNEPVTASPPSAVYRFRKLVWRHKVGFAAGAIITFLLLGGTVVSTWQAIRATHAEKLAATRLQSELEARGEAQTQQKLAVDRLQSALVAQADAEKQRQLAESRLHSETAARSESERQKAIAEEQRRLAVATEKLAQAEAAVSLAVSEFLQNDLLRQADSRAQAAMKAAPNPNLTVREALDRAAARVQERFRDQPHIEAGVREAIGKTYLGLGETEKSLPHFERVVELRKAALGAEHAATTASVHTLADTYRLQGRLTDAAALHASNLEIRRRTLPADHRDTLAAMNNLAIVYSAQGRLEEAAALNTEILAIRRRTQGNDHAETLTTIVNLAVVSYKRGRLDEALTLDLEALETQERVLGAGHPDTVNILRNLAHVYLAKSETDEAANCLTKAIAIRTQVLGEEHPDTLALLNDLAGVRQVQNRFDEAQSLLMQTISTSTRVLGAEHPDTLLAQASLSHVYWLRGERDEATVLLAQTCDAQRRVLGPEHTTTLAFMDRLATVFRAQDRLDEAAPLFEETYQTRLRVLGRNHRDTYKSARELGSVRIRQKKYREAEELLLKGCYHDLEAGSVNGFNESSRRAELEAIALLMEELYTYDGDEEQIIIWRQRRQMFGRPFMVTPDMPAGLAVGSPFAGGFGGGSRDFGFAPGQTTGITDDRRNGTAGTSNPYGDRYNTNRTPTTTSSRTTSTAPVTTVTPTTPATTTTEVTNKRDPNSTRREYTAEERAAWLAAKSNKSPTGSTTGTTSTPNTTGTTGPTGPTTPSREPSGRGPRNSESGTWVSRLFSGTSSSSTGTTSTSTASRNTTASSSSSASNSTSGSSSGRSSTWSGNSGSSSSGSSRSSSGDSSSSSARSSYSSGGSSSSASSSSGSSGSASSSSSGTTSTSRTSAQP